MECNRQNVLSFWTIFCPFITWQFFEKSKFEKLKKIRGDIIILHKCTKNHNHMLYYFLDITRDIFNCYFSFWAIFCTFTHLTAQKIKIKKKKKWKTRLDISSFYISVPKIKIRWCTAPEICYATDRRADGQQKWHTEVGAPPKIWWNWYLENKTLFFVK